MNNIIDSLGGRKFVLAVILLIAFTVIVCLGKMSVDLYVQSVMIVFGGFSLTNSISDIATNVSTAKKLDVAPNTTEEDGTVVE